MKEQSPKQEAVPQPNQAIQSTDKKPRNQVKSCRLFEMTDLKNEAKKEAEGADDKDVRIFSGNKLIRGIWRSDDMNRRKYESGRGPKRQASVKLKSKFDLFQCEDLH